MYGYTRWMLLRRDCCIEMVYCIFKSYIWKHLSQDQTRSIYTMWVLGYSIHLYYIDYLIHNHSDALYMFTLHKKRLSLCYDMACSELSLHTQIFGRNSVLSNMYCGVYVVDTTFLFHDPYYSTRAISIVTSKWVKTLLWVHIMRLQCILMLLGHYFIMYYYIQSLILSKQK